MTGFEFVISKLKDSSVKDLRQQAYIIATIAHETANTFTPIPEYGSPEYLKAKPYYPFIGRGYIQLTWKNNYELFGRLLKIDLVNNMELALEPETAWKICEMGMTKGLFTGKKLDDYLNDKITDWINSRRIINGIDKAEKIAKQAQEYLKIISP